MLARLVGLALGGKAGIASGAIVVATALISSAAPMNNAAPAAPDTVDPVPAVAALVVVTPAAAPARTAEPARRTEPLASASVAPATCAIDAQARAAALQAIRSSFTSSRAALDRLGAERTGDRAAETLDRADAMLAKIDRAAEDLVGATTCVADAREVTDRTVHAMEMVVDLARSATAPTPAPTERAKPTRRPRH